MASKKKLTQEELILAFNQYMPKRPVYPPLINAAETWENSDTDDDENDQEDPDPSKRQSVKFELSIEQSVECQKAYSDGKIKQPEVYLKDNVLVELEEALVKLINLRFKPADPVEWLAFHLMNISETKKHRAMTMKQRVLLKDHLLKPSGPQLDFKVLGTCTVSDRSPVKRLPNPSLPQCSTSGTSTSDSSSLCGKRKLTE